MTLGNPTLTSELKERLAAGITAKRPGAASLNWQPGATASSAIEARWQTQQPASEVLVAIPDEAAQRNLPAI